MGPWEVKGQKPLVELRLLRPFGNEHDDVDCVPKFLETPSHCAEGDVRLLFGRKPVSVPRARERNAAELSFGQQLEALAIAGIQRVLRSDLILLLELGPDSEEQPRTWEVVGLRDPGLSATAHVQVLQVHAQVFPAIFEHLRKYCTGTDSVARGRWCDEGVNLHGTRVTLANDDPCVHFSVRLVRWGARRGLDSIAKVGAIATQGTVICAVEPKRGGRRRRVATPSTPPRLQRCWRHRYKRWERRVFGGVLTICVIASEPCDRIFRRERGDIGRLLPDLFGRDLQRCG
mmetsp:Transcript_90200/g.254476  ORF Transcript_90200/g.254476 Transcript_90200/m.254476 type:complete len:288 (+) Transcript_90200:873-1736(+)